MEILPCPCCGGQAIIYPGNMWVSGTLQCQNCNVGIFQTQADSVESMVRRWNRRQKPVDTQAYIGKIRVGEDNNPEICIRITVSQEGGPVFADEWTDLYEYWKENTLVQMPTLTRSMTVKEANSWFQEMGQWFQGKAEVDKKKE